MLLVGSVVLLSIVLVADAVAGPSLAQLEGILDRAITMMGAFVGDGDPFTPGFDDNLLLLQQVPLLPHHLLLQAFTPALHVGAAFAGRVAYVWGSEPSIIERAASLKANAAIAFQSMPSLIVEACVFEIITSEVNSIAVPPHVFEAFDLKPPTPPRNFSYSSMLYADGTFVNHWGKNKSVPDWSQLEARMWFYFASDLYMSAGAEALHFGQLRLMTLNDASRANAWDLLSRVRARAAVVARRGFVMVNAHVFEEGWSFNNTLLLDFHAFPSRPRDIITRPPEAELRVSCLKHPGASSCSCLSANLTVLSHCVPYRRSAGGLTPSGYTASAPAELPLHVTSTSSHRGQVDSLPYLVELDNWGVSATPGRHVQHGDWTWGRDEITWFSLLNATCVFAWPRAALASTPRHFAPFRPVTAVQVPEAVAAGGCPVAEGSGRERPLGDARTAPARDASKNVVRVCFTRMNLENAVD